MQELEEYKPQKFEELNKLLEQIQKELVNKQKPLEPEVQKIINDNFWDLIDGEDKQQAEGKPSRIGTGKDSD